MLAIRLQRTGRSGHAQFRMVVQDSHISPKSGKVVAWVGSYNPHTKQSKLDTDKISFYLKNGARPSDRAAQLLKAEKVKLPEWFAPAPKKKSAIKNTEKLRRNRPAAPAESEKEKVESSEAETAAAEEATTKAPAAEEKPADEAKTEPAETEAESPTEEAKE